MSGFNIANTDLTIEASTSAVGQPTNGRGYVNLCRGGKVRFLTANGVQPIVQQVGNNVDISFNVSNGMAAQPPRITSVVQNGSNYTITGTGLPGSTIRINGVSAPVLANGTFTITAPLTPGQNILVQQALDGSELNNVIYLINGGQPVPVPGVVVTELTDNGDGTYTVSGTGTPGETINVGGVNVTIGPDGTFTVPDAALGNGVNLITDSNGNTVGSIFVQECEGGDNVVVTSVEADGLGTYIVTGTGTPGEVITVGGVTTTVLPDGTFVAEGATLVDGTNPITDADGNTVGSIFVQPGGGGSTVTITTVVDNGDGTYTVTGTGPAGETITVGGVDVVVAADGTFTVPNATLVDGLNNVTDADGNVIGSVFVQPGTSTDPVLVTDVIDNGDGTFTVTGSYTPGETITVGGVDVVVAADGTFTVPNAVLAPGSNPITDTDGNTVGSIFVQPGVVGDIVTITTVVDNGDGTFTVTGSYTPGETITVGGVDVIVEADGTFSVPNATLVDGVNDITDADGNVVGSIFVQPGGVAIPTVVTSVVDNGDGTFTVTGTSVPGETITVGGVDVIVEADGTFSVPNATLVEGTNDITDTDGNTIGSIFVQSTGGDNAVTVGDVVDNGDGTFTVTGTGTPGETITVGGVDVVVAADGTFTVPNATLLPGLNDITDADGNTIGSIFFQSSAPPTNPVVVTSVVDNGDGTYTVTGAGTSVSGQTITVGGVDVVVAADGTFTVPNAVLILGANPIINEDGMIIGSIFIIEGAGSTVTVGDVVDNGDGTYTVTGTGTPGETITVGGVDVVVEADGTFSVPNAVLAPGVNDITDTDGNTIGSIFVQPGGVGNVAIVDSVVDNGDGTFTVTGSYTPGETITVGGVDVVVEADGTFTVPNAALVDGVNDITDADGNVVGSIFLSVPDVVLLDALVIDEYDNSDPANTVISGSGAPPNGTISVNTEPPTSVTVAPDGTFTLEYDSTGMTGNPVVTVTTEDGLQSTPAVIYPVEVPPPLNPFAITGNSTDGWTVTGGDGLAPDGTVYSIVDGDGVEVATGTYGPGGINAVIDPADAAPGDVLTIQAPVGTDVGSVTIPEDPEVLDIEVEGIVGGVIPPEVLATGVNVDVTLPESATAGQVIVVTVTDGDDNESAFLHPITPADIAAGTVTVNIPGDNFPGGSYSVQAGLMSMNGNLSTPVSFTTDAQLPTIVNTIIGADLLYDILGVNISGVPSGSYDIAGTLVAAGVTADVSTTGVDLDGYALLEVTNDVDLSGIQESGVLTLTLTPTAGGDDITIVSNVMVDTTPPSSPVVTSGSLTVLPPSVTISGTADPGTLVVLELPVAVDGQTNLTDATGNWTITVSLEDILPVPVPAALYMPLYAIDAAGNRSPTVILNLIDFSP